MPITGSPYPDPQVVVAAKDNLAFDAAYALIIDKFEAVIDARIQHVREVHEVRPSYANAIIAELNSLRVQMIGKPQMIDAQGRLIKN